MNGERFSKKALVAYLEERYADIVKAQNFDPSNGSSQLRGDPHTIVRAVEYGRMDAIRDLLDELD